MDKILLEVYLPAENKSYDVYIPLKSKLYEITALLSNTFTDLSQGYFIGNTDTLICDKVTGVIFNINMSAEELGLMNGSKLMLI
ncbi:hypothetical protein SAMN05444401_2960 [Clostridium amylolyticum]|uniref:Methyltransferase n=1 Tax=Clostridium amylolyticum TaxID=1121298 RepID=A0A1M6J5Z5_9CLOT|nr:methyltransferase [Clostridium amylolyticum]SHJ42079.1 hypothetical protein SAMN05444401_2960 [Clostridium amylolyticum]